MSNTHPTIHPGQKALAILAAVALVLTLLAVPLSHLSTKAADAAGSYTYTLTGNTGATITGKSSISSAKVSDTSIATVSVSGKTATVTGVSGACGTVTVTVDDTTFEVPIGYTTFDFDGETVTVYEGSDTKYEVFGQTSSDTEEHALTETSNSDGSTTYASTDGSKVNVDIKKAGGTYVFTGTGSDASIAVKKEATGAATLLFAGLDLTSSYTSPVTIKKNSTSTVTITALAGTTNTLTDADFNNADTYGDTEDGGDGTNAEYAESAVIKGKDYANLTLNGTGTLNLNCKTKNAVKVGEYGSLTVEDLTLNVTSAKHGLSSDNTLTVNSGTLNLTVEQDAIRADPDAVDADAGCAGKIELLGGTITISAEDDGVHAEGDLVCGKDGGSDSALNVTITRSYEGLEGSTVSIYSGTYDITASDDGINSAGGSSDTTTSTAAPTAPGGQGGFGQQGGQASTTGLDTTIYGGKVTVNAAADGLDSNGNLTISGGTVVVWGAAANSDRKSVV